MTFSFLRVMIFVPILNNVVTTNKEKHTFIHANSLYFYIYSKICSILFKKFQFLCLLYLNQIFFQNSVIEWSRDHRVHHKYSETDADPHNAKRGFFFSHMGWLLCRKHPDVIEQGKKLDISDLYADPIIRFQHKYYLILMPLICFVLPVPIPVLLWNETWVNSFCLNVFRYIFTLHASWLVNSAAHMWGDRPYDK